MWAKKIGAATASVILGVSSWRSWFGSEESINELNSRKLHLAKCTAKPSLIHREVPPDESVNPPSVHPDETSNSSLGKTCTSLSSSESSIARCRRLVRRAMLERGIPGAVVAVMKDGELVWSEGMGYADVENDVPCTPDTPMRIASISKPFTAVALLQLWQKGLVDLDAPVQRYVPEFPEKEYNGEKVVVTTRHLLSHMAGIRHYDKAPRQKEDSGSKAEVKEFDHEEYYIKTHFNSVLDSLKLFADDDLLSKPGTEYYYTTHGWTLISAVLEKVSNKQFLQYMDDHVFKPLGMSATHAEFHQPLVYNRARHYVRCENGLLQNTPYIDISYKWAGGGFISTAQDLTKFGNAVLTCYQFQTQKSTGAQSHYVPTKGGGVHHLKQTNTSADGPRLHCILEPDTISMMWRPVVCPNKSKPHIGYAMGWIVRDESSETIGGRSQPFYAAHSGGAVGASSVLVIMPTKNPSVDSYNDKGVFGSKVEIENAETCVYEPKVLPRGVVVAILFNLQEVTNVTSLGVQISEEFL